MTTSNLSAKLRSAMATFGAEAKAKLANLAATGEPEDQLRAPLERLVVDLAELCGLPRTAVAAVGESSLRELKTRPDYAVTVRNALVGFIEVKAPGKGADPRRFRDGTTRSSGKSCSRSRICSTPTATRSASGGAASWSARSCVSAATSRRPAPSLPPRPAC